MDYNVNYKKLLSEFSIGKKFEISDTNIEVQFFDFISADKSLLKNTGENFLSDAVEENNRFEYPVFINRKNNKPGKAILLLHGLNERNWNKYLTWAEYLCRETAKAVILFPIAYHINRSPAWWSNPRIKNSFLEKRKNISGNESSVSFANFALSERISENPYRFYESGKQSFLDIETLLKSIDSGQHPLFERNTITDVFAYSIGAFLAQLLFMINPSGLLSESKLFVFCGGSIFNRMFGQSRSILDKSAFEMLHNYYMDDFYKFSEVSVNSDQYLSAFSSMIKEENNQTDRISFFKMMKKRFAGIALKKDIVIPYNGIIEAIGSENSKSVELYDFNFDYTHENPFPVYQNNSKNEVNNAFNEIFGKVAAFLA